MSKMLPCGCLEICTNQRDHQQIQGNRHRLVAELMQSGMDQVEASARVFGDRSGKDDKGKVPAYQGLVFSFPRALMAIAAHTAKGAAEPGHHWHGWKDAEDGFVRYSNAFMRHLLQEDNTVGKHPSLAPAVIATCWNDLARLEHLLMDAERGGIDAAPEM